MSNRLRQVSVRLGGLALVTSALLGAGSAHAEYTEPARVDAIEQASASAFGGVTFVRLVGPRCPGRSDGFFVLPSGGRQQLQLDILLKALQSTPRVRINFTPETCVAASVAICAVGSPC